MAIDDRHLPFRDVLVRLADRRQIEGRCEPGAIRAREAMDQQRFRSVFHDLDQFLRARWRKLLVGRHREIDMLDSKRLRLLDFGVPYRAVGRAAQVDDGLDPIPLREIRNGLRGWLRRTVDFAGDDRVEVVRGFQIESIAANDEKKRGEKA